MNLSLSGRNATWLALVAVMAVSGWFTGKGMHRSALAKQTEVDAEASKREHTRAKRESFPADSAEGKWMEKVRNASAQDYYQLCEEWLDTFEWDERYERGYAPNAVNALKWVMSKWLMDDLDDFLRKAHEFDDRAAADVFVELMPQKALEFTLNAENSILDENFYQHVVTSFARQNPDVFMEYARGNKLVADYADGWQWADAIRELAKTDAYKATQLCTLMKLDDVRNFHELALILVNNWNEGDPPMSEWVDLLEDPEMQNVFHHARLTVLAETDPERALEEVYQLNLDSDNLYERDSARNVLKHYAVKYPVKAIRLLAELEAHFSREPEDNGDINPFDPPQAPSTDYTAWESQSPFSHLSYGPGYDVYDLESNEAREEILYTIAEKLPNDPAGFMASIHKISKEAGVGDEAWKYRLEGYLVDAKSSEWTADECYAVAKAWKSVPDEDGDDYTLHSLARQAAYDDPYRALERLEDFPAREQAYLVSEIIGQLPDSEVTMRTELLQRLPLDEWDDVLGQMMGSKASEYADLMASRAAPETRRAVSSYVSSWAEKDPVAAAQWSLALPDPQVVSSAIDGLMWQWTQYDVDSAEAWATTLPPGPALDSASEDMVSLHKRENPELAWQWAKQISNVATKADSFQEIYERWHDAPEDFKQAFSQARIEAGLPAMQEKEVER